MWKNNVARDKCHLCANLCADLSFFSQTRLTRGPLFSRERIHIYLYICIDVMQKIYLSVIDIVVHT